jgi:hypothetical protein
LSYLLAHLIPPSYRQQVDSGLATVGPSAATCFPVKMHDDSLHLKWMPLEAEEVLA